VSRLPRRRFDRGLRRLSAAAFGAFVADLWAVRGYETRVVDGGSRVIAVRTADAGDPERRELVVGHDARPLGRLRTRWTVDATPATAVVTSGEGSATARSLADTLDADLVAATDLYHTLSYGVDATARGRLRKRYFRDAPAGPPPGVRLRRMAATSGRAVRVGAILAVLGLVLVGVVGTGPVRVDRGADPAGAPGPADGRAFTPTPWAGAVADGDTVDRGAGEDRSERSHAPEPAATSFAVDRAGVLLSERDRSFVREYFTDIAAGEPSSVPLAARYYERRAEDVESRMVRAYFRDVDSGTTANRTTTRAPTSP